MSNKALPGIAVFSVEDKSSRQRTSQFSQTSESALPAFSAANFEKCISSMRIQQLCQCSKYLMVFPLTLKSSPGGGVEWSFPPGLRMLHYHIRWSTKAVLDWEAFESRAEAEKAAQQLVRHGETYAIEERDEHCPRCWKSFHVKIQDSDPSREYPWQRAVVDALQETRPEQLIIKISAAQLAMSARLLDPAPPDRNEQAAIRDAIKALRSLAPKRSKANEERSDEKETA